MSTLLPPLLVTSALLCSLVAGFLFAFAVVIMPGIGNLGNREFVRAFQEIDGVIQRGQPLFGLVWLGSAVALVAGLVLGVGQLAGTEKILLITAAGLYLLGVQAPTFTVNVPLNNTLQALKVADASDAALASARQAFEARWNLWNSVRTVMATLAVAILLVLLQLQ